MLFISGHAHLAFFEKSDGFLYTRSHFAQSDFSEQKVGPFTDPTFCPIEAKKVGPMERTHGRRNLKSAGF